VEEKQTLVSILSAAAQPMIVSSWLIVGVSILNVLFNLLLKPRKAGSGAAGHVSPSDKSTP
jgi:hypothetical protein